MRSPGFHETRAQGCGFGYHDGVKVNELFCTIQGEGKLAGMPSVFVRTSGCNLRCTWCDTPTTSWAPQGEQLDVTQIRERVSRYNTHYVVLTGGEPMIAPRIGELSRCLNEDGYHVTIETAATVWKDVVCDLASISPKLRNSTPVTRDGGRWADVHEKTRINLDVIRRFMQMPDYQLKFVVDVPDDMTEIDMLLDQLGPYEDSNVLLMPQGVTDEELRRRSGWIAEICRTRGFRFCPRLHISLYGHVRGT